MHPDVLELRAFYASALGSVARRLLAGRIRARWRSANGAQLMGLGYAVPYLGMFRGEAARLGALMPASQGAVAWPASGNGQTVMVEEALLPLPDASIDRLLAVHCLEASERTGALLREMWRVLTPEGRLLLIVPNRRGVWARMDSTPFGHGRPYSRGQLERLLRELAVHAHRVEQRPLHAAAGSAMADPLGDGLRAHGPAPVAGLCRRHHGGGAQGIDGRAAGQGQDAPRHPARPSRGRTEARWIEDVPDARAAVMKRTRMRWEHGGQRV